MLDFITAAWLGLLGACVGSFLNVVAYRLPLGQTLVRGGSRCTQCGYPIRLYDNLPVLSWLLLRGRCRDCGVSISPRYAVVEALTGGAFFLLAYVELYSGGANLPSGAISRWSGSLQNFWLPEWKLITVYLIHCVLLTMLMATSLLQIDKNRLTKGLIAATLLVTILPAVIWNGALAPIMRWGSHSDGLVEAMIETAVGIVAGVLAGAACERIVRRIDYLGLAVPLAAVGGTLGWKSVLPVTAAALVMTAAWALLRGKRGIAAAMPAAVVAATLVYICLIGHFVG